MHIGITTQWQLFWNNHYNIIDHISFAVKFVEKQFLKKKNNVWN